MVAPLRSIGASAGATDEIRLLADLPAADVVPTAVLEPADAVSGAELGAALPGTCTWVLVRTPTTSPSPTSCLVLVDAGAAPAAALVAAASCADVVFGVSHSRFTGSLSPSARSGETAGADETLMKLSVASGHPLPPPSWDRVARIVERLRARAAGAPILLQALAASSEFGTASSRDPRSGEGPLRVVRSSAPAALFDPRPAERPIGELELSPVVRGRLEALASRGEAALEKPVRASFSLVGEALSVVSIQPLRTSGIGTCAIAADLARAGVVSREQALGLVSARDLAAAVPVEVETEAGATTVKGIAAGAGIAEGFICLSPFDVLVAARAGLRPILVAHEIFPDEIEALRACVGVITVRGGLTGEAAVMARGLSKPCVASGATLALAEDHVRILEGGKLDAGERITIDGSTGLISRGAHPRRLGQLPRSVAEVFELVDVEPGRPVIARVEHPAHVVTAVRLGARGVALGPVGAILLPALRASSPLAETLEAMITAIFAAARESFAAIHFAAPARAVVLPRPIGRETTPAELELYEATVRRCAAAVGIPLEAADDGGTCDPDDILTARLSSALPPPLQAGRSVAR